MKRNECSDSELVKRLRADDIAAFDASYERYHQALYRNILRFTKDTEAAADLLQEVFMALWNNRATLDPRKSMGGWLFSVSFNRSVTYARKMLREASMKEEVTRVTAGREEAFCDACTNEHHYLLLEEAVGQLSPQQQRVFTLCKLQGRSYDEAARKMNLSRHTVKEYLSLAMASVKKYVHTYAESHGIAIAAWLLHMIVQF